MPNLIRHLFLDRIIPPFASAVYQRPVRLRWYLQAGVTAFKQPLTTQANPQLEEIHNEKKRMPFVVGSADREAWMRASDPVEIRRLMCPWEGEFQAHRTARVTAIRGTDTNVPEIQKEI